MAGVLLEQVSRVYPGGVVAVSEIDLEVRDREFLVLVGPSGSGKSTTLRMIAGLEPVSNGRIRIDGREVSCLPPQRRNLAMVFQSQALYPHLSVYENLAFGLELRRRAGRWRRVWSRIAGRDGVSGPASEPSRVGNDEIEERVRRAARQLGIEALLGRMPGELSGGERQRVALGRALVHEPAAFLFDEPLSNLDAQLRIEMRRELKRLAGELETTVIYVTHDQVEALTLGDRIVVLERGKVQQVGAPSEVYDRPANRFVASFIGAPPMNLVEGRLVDLEAAGSQPDRTELRFAGPGWSALVAAEHRETLACSAGTQVVFGIRPEHVRLAEAAEAMPARVAASELMGDARMVELDLSSSESPASPRRAETAGRSIWCKVDASCRVGLGDRVSVSFDMRRAHWFNALTGSRLCEPRDNRG